MREPTTEHAKDLPLSTGRRVLYALFTIAFGAFAGAFAWAFFFLMNTGVHLLWETVPATLARRGLDHILMI